MMHSNSQKQIAALQTALVERENLILRAYNQLQRSRQVLMRSKRIVAELNAQNANLRHEIEELRSYLIHYNLLH